jgi:hypothetical protein
MRFLKIDGRQRRRKENLAFAQNQSTSTAGDRHVTIHQLKEWSSLVLLLLSDEEGADKETKRKRKVK